MKYAVVVGAGGGMGKATCALLSEQGYKVWGLDVVFPEEECPYSRIVADITDLRAVERAFETIKGETSRLDAIIHMAGVYRLNSLVEMSEETFTGVFQINLFGVYRVNKVFLPLLGKGSRILITTSELAPLDPLPFTGIYGISKTALEKYAYSLRMELQLLGIGVIVIRPGAVKTGLLSVSTKQLDLFCEKTELYRCNAERFRKIVNSVETKSVSPERIAAAALRALRAKRTKYVVNVNRNLGLRILNALPAHWQTAIVKKILLPEKGK